MNETKLTWGDRMALRIMAWIAGVLMSDELRNKDFDAIRTSLSLGDRYGL